MERKPEHLQEDPSLRLDFIEQESLDEFVKRLYPGINEPEFDEYCAQTSVDPERLRKHVEYEWKATLNRNTTVNEVQYLMGQTARATRLAAIDQMHAALRDDAVARGLVDPDDRGEISDSDLPEL